MILNHLYDKGLIYPPKWLLQNIIYLSLMGSQSYGTSEEKSDQDLYGIAIPYKEDVFPHLRGEINGFGRQKKAFEQFQQHGVFDKEKSGQYDVTVYSIVKYFNLAMNCNPNIVDSLFVPSTCVLYSTLVGQKIRENRHKFLHRGIYHKLKGYSFAQLGKIGNSYIKNNNPVIVFENKMNLNHNIKLSDLEKELKSRNLHKLID